MKRAISIVLQVTLLVGLTTTAIGTATASAVTLDPNCTNGGTLLANDDGSTDLIPLAFDVNFFGETYDSLYINNNGNFTFTQPLGDYTPDPLSSETIPIIAAFWSDVDTRSPESGTPSAQVTWGTTTFDSRPAFCASWDGVGEFSENTSNLDNFQLLLVDRSDVDTGDFDIVFNYQHIGWDHGGARAGYTNGTESTSYELPGSGDSGSFLDSNMSTGLVNSSNNSVNAGQYIYPVRNGAPPHQLAVSKDGTGAGTVTSSPAGIDCGATCSASFTSGTPVTLTATPDAGSVFTGWTGSGCSSNSTCDVTMDADHAVNATFDTAPGSISGTVWNDANGNGQQDGGGGGSLAPAAPVVHPADAAEVGVPGVTVCLDLDSNGTCGGEDTNTLTDEDGHYLFTGLSPGDYHVYFTVPGGWHNTGIGDPNDHYDVTLEASENNNGNDFFIQQDAEGSGLGLTKSGSPDPVQEQNPISYTLSVTNAGPGDANDVVLTDTLPAGTTFDQASTPQGSCSFDSGTVTCNLGTVSPTGDGSLDVSIIVQAPNVTEDTTITNNASVSASNADPASASFDSHVLVNTGGSTSGDVPQDTTVPLTYTTGTQSNKGQPAVDGTDQSAVSIIIPAGGPGGTVSLDELPCPVAPCTGPDAAKDRAATQAASAGSVVLGGVVFDIKPPAGYPNNKPFRVTLLYDKTLHPKQGPVFYFKQGVTPTEIKLPHCGTTSPNGGKPCVLQNLKITKGSPLIKGDWRIVVRINSDPRMHK